MKHDTNANVAKYMFTIVETVRRHIEGQGQDSAVNCSKMFQVDRSTFVVWRQRATYAAGS